MGKNLLAWSGGCDSTALLINYLNDNKQIRTFSVSHPQISATPYEHIARKKLKKMLEKISGNKFEHTNVKISGGEIINIGCGGLPQVGAWLAHGINNLRVDEDLICGYIRTDDVWHYKSSVIDAFESHKKVVGKQDCSICFPFEWVDKREVIDTLCKFGLLNHTWYCEYPTKNHKRCGKCRKCAEIRMLVAGCS